MHDPNLASEASGSLAEVVAIVGVVVRRAHVDAASNFFDLDGASFGSPWKVFSQLEERFGAEVSLSDFFEGDDMSAVAELIDAQSPRSGT